MLLFFTKQYIQIKDFGGVPSLFISPRTLAPRSWSAGPARTTVTSLVPCPWLCPRRGTSPCPPSLCTPPCCHAIPLPRPLHLSPGTASALFRGCEMIFLWRTWRKNNQPQVCFEKKEKTSWKVNFLHKIEELLSTCGKMVLNVPLAGVSKQEVQQYLIFTITSCTFPYSAKSYKI